MLVHMGRQTKTRAESKVLSKFCVVIIATLMLLFPAEKGAAQATTPFVCDSTIYQTN